jgi:NAD(P)-dependent dehydrogenase (short-subunit alcohol dehydrogenase family)
MVEHGAKHLTFLSRSNVNHPEAELMADDLRNRGVEIDIIKCDVTIKEEVTAAVGQASSERMIKGVLHAAMVLEVRKSAMPQKEGNKPTN